MIDKIENGSDIDAVIDKVNELIDMANELIGVGLAGVVNPSSSCCTEEKEHKDEADIGNMP